MNTATECSFFDQSVKWSEIEIMSEAGAFTLNHLFYGAIYSKHGL